MLKARFKGRISDDRLGQRRFPEAIFSGNLRARLRSTPKISFRLPGTLGTVYCELTWAWSSFLMKWICLWDVTALLLFPSSLLPPVFPPAYAEPGCVAVYTGSLNRKAHMVVLLSITSQAVHLPWCWPTALIFYESSSTCITSEVTRSFLFFLGALDQTLGVGHHPRPILPGWGTPAISWCFNKPMA